MQRAGIGREDAIMSDVSRAFALSESNLVSFDPRNPTAANTIGITGLTIGETYDGVRCA
jgi:hypothetical protein